MNVPVKKKSFINIYSNDDHELFTGALRAVFVFLLVFIPFSCSTGSGMMDKVEMNQYMFMDDDTMLLKVSNADVKDGYSKDKQKSTLKNAEKNAKYMAMEYIKGYVTESADGMIDMDFINKEVALRFKKTVEEGTVIQKEFDKDDNCIIIFQVKKKNLKRLIMEVPRYPGY